MNRWKFAFFTLAGLIVAVLVYLVLLIGEPAPSDPIPKIQSMPSKNSVLTVKASRDNLEDLANTFIRKAMKGEPLPVTMEVADDVILHSEMTAFSFTFPVIMHFDPVVNEDGDLILKQSSLEIGNINLPPSTILKILRDSFKLPEWMIVRPKEEEIFINLAELPLSGDLLIKAKTFNLPNNEIIFEVSIPNE